MFTHAANIARFAFLPQISYRRCRHVQARRWAYDRVHSPQCISFCNLLSAAAWLAPRQANISRPEDGCA